LAFPDENARF